jgi:hypothetical protein
MVLATAAGWATGDCPIYGGRYRKFIANQHVATVPPHRLDWLLQMQNL